jgi:20S proteasome alpha/beta subunit
MTIAVGMRYDGGVLVCADSLVTTGTLGSYQSKILAYRIDGADVVFALAGNVDLAESAWQQCESSLMKYAGKKTSAREIASSLRSVLGKEYKEQIIDCRYENTHYDYCFVIAIRVDGSKAELYRTYSMSLKKSRKGRECIGAGADLAQLLLSWVRHQSLSAEQLGEIAAHMVATLKIEMPGVIGGSNLIGILTDSGEILFYTRAEIDLLVQYGRTYDLHARELLWKFLDTSIDESTFKENADRFCQVIAHYRKKWRGERERILFSTPPSEADEAIIDFRTSAQSVPSKSKHDRLSPQPSPE